MGKQIERIWRGFLVMINSYLNIESDMINYLKHNHNQISNA